MRNVEQCRSLSSLLGLAIRDVKKTLKQDIRLNMDMYINLKVPYWDRSDICSVCLAGAVLVNHSTFTNQLSFLIGMPPILKKSILALDSLRLGNIILAVERFYGYEDYWKIKKAVDLQHSWDSLRKFEGDVTDVEGFISYLEELKTELKKRKL